MSTLGSSKALAVPRVSGRLSAGAVALVVFGGGLLVACGGEESEQQLLRGKTDQSLPVKLELEDGRRLRALDVSWEGPCREALLEGGVKRTRRQVDVVIRQDGSFAWNGRHRVMSEGVDPDLRLPVRLAGRIRADGSVRAKWSTGDAVHPKERFYRCWTMATNLRAQRERSRAPGLKLRAIPLDDGGRAVVVSAGHVWVLGDGRTDQDSSSRPTVVRVDTASGRVSAPFDVRGGTLGASGAAAWLVGYEHTRTTPHRSRVTLSRLDPRADRAQPVPDRPPWPELNPDVNGLAITDNAVWIMQDARLLQIDARSGQLVRTILPPKVSSTCESSGQFVHIAAGMDAVWAVVGQSLQECDAREPLPRLVRLDPRSGRITRTITLRHGAQTLAAGSAGVWVSTDNGVRQTLRRVDLQDDQPPATIGVPSAPVPGTLAVGDRTVWLTGERAGRGVLQRLDPGARRTVVVRRLRGNASTVAVEGDTAWIVDGGTRELLRTTR